jgi:hypothetical protein
MKSKIEKYLTIEKARELFEMRGPDVYRIKAKQGIKPGRENTPAGCVVKYSKTFYRQIYLKTPKGNKLVLAHSLAFGLHHGRWASTSIDHKDTNGLNNSKDNLREANKSANMCNVPLRSNNTTGVKGVSISKAYPAKPYRASLKHKNKYVFIKYFKTLEEATVAIRAARELHHGEFCNHG